MLEKSYSSRSELIAIAYGYIIETALKRPENTEARTLEHLLFHFKNVTTSWKSQRS